MKPISIDLRKRVIESRQEGEPLGQIAKRFKLPKSTVQHLIEHHKATGSLEPKPRKCGRKPAFQGEALRKLEEDVQANPGATLEQLRQRSGMSVSLVAIHNTLQKILGFTFKKNRYARVSRTGKT